MSTGSYGYMVVKNVTGIPLHIVQVKHEQFASFAVFNSARHANKYINDLWKGGLDIAYKNDFEFSSNLTRMYKDSVYLFTNINNRQVYAYYR